MMLKRRLSRRELWLVCLMPAALVVIASLGLPKGETSRIPDMERRLNLLTSDEALARRAREQRDLTNELRESEQTLAELKNREAQLKERVDALRVPSGSRASAMAQGLDRLTRQLSRNGVQVLGMLPQGGTRVSTASQGRPATSVTSPRPNPATSAATRPATGATANRSLSRRQRRKSVDASALPRTSSSANRLASTSTGTTRRLRWQVDVAATWSAMGRQLAAADTFPPGLALSALTMEPALTSTSLRRWALTVTDTGGEP
ncbi:MAG: hypothetical protein AAGA68_16390 [Pseudomonadota bacterium]